MNAYDPFAAGPEEVRVDTISVSDERRNRTFAVDVWTPDSHERGPLVIYSHRSGGNRRAATFVCRHLAGHGYTVAAMDHSEVAARDQLPADRRQRIEAEGAHEAVRHPKFPEEAAWIPRAMVPITELSSGERAHDFVRGLTLAYLDATLRQSGPALRFLDGDVQAALAARGVDAMPARRSTSSR